MLLASVAHTEEIRQLSADVHLLRGEFPEGRQPDGNSVILTAADGVILIDTGRHRGHTQKLIEFARARNSKIVAVINTHWHLDHVGGNVLLRERDPDLRVYASDAFRAAQSGFLMKYRDQLIKAIANSTKEEELSTWRAEVLLIDNSAKWAPDVLIDSSAPLTVAGRTLHLYVERGAATAGDVWLEDRKNRLVVAGDLVTLPVPFFDTACAPGWELALQHIATVQFDTLIPGHGPPLSREQFNRYRTGFSALRTCASSNRKTNECSKLWIDATGDLIDARDLDRVPAMLDYYLNALRSSPQSCG
jgi:glyoxylase-like metal-dependent hydrolase (beta-lactamase superfamily II)